MWSDMLVHVRPTWDMAGGQRSWRRVLGRGRTDQVDATLGLDALSVLA